MDTRVRRALVRLCGATVVVLGVAVTATAVRPNDQVVASGRDVLLGGELVDVFAGGDLDIDGHAQLAGTAVALGDLYVRSGSLRVEREASRQFAVGGAVHVDESATVVFPEAGALRYGTIRSGARGGSDTVIRDQDAVADFAAMVPSLHSSTTCFARTPSTGVVRELEERTMMIGDGVSALQVFHIDSKLTGTIEFSRVPTTASILINVTGRDVTIAPDGPEWEAVSEFALVNVVAAADTLVDAGESRHLNVLVGAETDTVHVIGDRLVGSLLALGNIELGNTRLEHAALKAWSLPECTVDALAGADGAEETVETTPPVVSEFLDETSSTGFDSTSTTTSTTTTTTVAVGEQARGASPVPGAAFALGGAATATRWWIGVPLVLVGLLLLVLSWVDQHWRVQLERLRGGLIAVRLPTRGARGRS